MPSLLFFRVEHSSILNPWLQQFGSNNNNNNNIKAGPWTLLDLFSSEEGIMMADISVNHALPYYKLGRPFDSEINAIVKSTDDIEDRYLKEHFLYGCSARHLINRYFPNALREILHNRGFHIGVYASSFVFSSKFQSVMDISKPFEFVGTQSLVA